MPYWGCVQLKPNKAALALHCLAAAGYVAYYPRLREQRRSHGRKIEIRPPLFLLRFRPDRVAVVPRSVDAGSLQACDDW
jgi:hypothetical protein